MNKGVKIVNTNEVSPSDYPHIDFKTMVYLNEYSKKSILPHIIYHAVLFTLLHYSYYKNHMKIEVKYSKLNNLLVIISDLVNSTRGLIVSQIFVVVGGYYLMGHMSEKYEY